MEAHVEDLIRVVKDVLSTVTMVYIPVKDQHFFAFIYSMLCSYCDIIEEAEALDVFTVRMVPWRAYYAVAFVVSRLLGQDLINSFNACLTCKFGSHKSMLILIIILC